MNVRLSVLSYWQRVFMQSRVNGGRPIIEPGERVIKWDDKTWFQKRYKKVMKEKEKET